MYLPFLIRKGIEMSGVVERMQVVSSPLLAQTKQIQMQD